MVHCNSTYILIRNVWIIGSMWYILTYFILAYQEVNSLKDWDQSCKLPHSCRTISWIAWGNFSNSLISYINYIQVFAVDEQPVSLDSIIYTMRISNAFWRYWSCMCRSICCRKEFHVPLYRWWNRKHCANGVSLSLHFLILSDFYT